MAVDEEEFILWQDVFDQLAARRGEPLACPYCQQKPLAVEESPNGVTRISCPACKKYIEGRMGLG